MKLKISKATVSLILAAALVTPVAAGVASPFSSALHTESAHAQSGSLDYIDYNAEELAVTEDYSALVDSATATSINGGYWANNRALVKLGDMQRQLDDGRSGLLVSSMRSGDGADGSGFAFTNRLYDDFSMDFRVFSQETYEGFFSIDASSLTDDRFNSFLDLKEVGITIASVSDPRVSFTIDVRGASKWNAAQVNASVYVSGESYVSGEYRGYGIMSSGAHYANYATELKGTSFCNASQTETNGYTSIQVDMETMRVYGVSRETTFVSGTPVVEEKRVLVRDLLTNCNESGVLIAEGLGSVSPDAFKDGYRVSVQFNDVTADTTELKKTAYKSVGDGFFANGEGVPVDENGATVYERYAKMLIYSLNGQTFDKNAGFTAADASFGENDYTWSDGETAIEGSLQLTANETGVNAEGASFSYNGVQTGVFEQEFLVNTNVGNPVNINNTTAASRYNGGNGYIADDAYPYADVKQVAFDFVSNSDPGKQFTLYIRASSGTWAQAYSPSARVAVSGDRICTTDFETGYGLNTGRWIESNGEVTVKTENVGAFNPTTNSKLDGGFGNAYNTNNHGCIKIKFDPIEMKVYGMANGGYALIRDLANNGGTGVPLDYVASLSAADFSQGYTVRFRFADVQRNGFCGLENDERFVNNQGTVQAVGGNTPPLTAAQAQTRTARITLKDVTESELTYSGAVASAAAYDKQQPILKVGELVKDIESDLAPVFGGVMSTGARIAGNISYQNGEQGGEIRVSGEGKYLFVPTRYGVYDFTVPVEWDGTTVDRVVSVRVKDIINPTVSLKEGLAEAWIYSENGRKPVLSDDDVHFADDSGVCSVNISVSLDKKSIALANAFTEAGVYEIVYTVSDEFGNSASVSRKITVYAADGEAPVISVFGGDKTVEVGSRVELPTYSCVDNYDGELTVTVKVYLGDSELAVENGGFTVSEEGEYKIVYTAVDANGNAVTETVTVTAEKGSGGSAWIVVGGILAAVAVGGVVACLVVIKRKKDKKQEK
ncbi:MAG: hypothetical protein IJ514_00245 [Clostridia bacterium]|nr:hypothetical protein [Clostridia bacterium]